MSESTREDEGETEDGTRILDARFGLLLLLLLPSCFEVGASKIATNCKTTRQLPGSRLYFWVRAIDCSCFLRSSSLMVECKHTFFL
jgi:hypothetical protein